MSTPRLFWSLAVAAGLVVAQAGKPDFSGAWKTDGSKSTTKITPVKKPDPGASEAPPPPPLDEQPAEVIEQKGNRLRIGDLTFTLDGAENVNQLGQDITHKSRTHWDGNELVIEWVMERDGETLVKARQVRILSEDGKTQTVNTHVETSQVISDTHAVMAKQK
jgi:hypothetical protein